MYERNYTKLVAWKEAYKLCLSIYRFTSAFPSYERFGLTNQMRRAASSVPFNIAEGNAKRSNPDKIRYIDIAIGSLEELHCETLLSVDLEYLPKEKFGHIDQRINRVSYLLNRLRSALAK